MTMADLKELLGPLSDREMPDRWDRIQRRSVEPIEDPRRSSAAAMLVASAFAVVTLAVVVVLSPLGTGSGPEPRGPETQPPAWLVDKAYETAYKNGDITPDSASWVLSDANTIAPAIGLESGDPSVQQYLVVLHGHFTAFMARVPPGASLPKGSILTFAVDVVTREVTDWGVGDREVDIPGLQSFTLPDASQMYTSPQGWTIAVPPAWKIDAYSSEGSMIANGSRPAPSAEDPTSWETDGFPLDGVALVVATAGADVPANAQVSRPPLSFDDFVTLASLTGSGSTDFTALVQGPDARYFAIVRIGRQASPIDRAAIENVVASLTFEPRATPEPTTTQQTASPSKDAVVDGRFVKSVQLDDGQLRVDPAPEGTDPPTPRTVVEDELWASPVFQGKSDGVLGWGLVTLAVTQHGIDTVTSAPAWIAFGWGGAYDCPMITAAPSPVDLPSDGYVAVVVGSTTDTQPFSYTARSRFCGNPPVGPTVQPATHVESVSWDQVGPVSNDSVEISYTPAPCGSDPTFNIGGGPSGTSIAVDITVPDAAAPCPSPQTVKETLDVPDGGTQLHHAPTGYVRQL
jgi:hypothetical protein